MMSAVWWRSLDSSLPTGVHKNGAAAMPSFVDVPYHHEHDWAAVRDLVLHSQFAARTDRWPTIAELRIVCHPERTDWIKHVWLDATDHFRAFALLDRIYGSFWFWVPPPHAPNTVALQIIPALQELPWASLDVGVLTARMASDGKEMRLNVNHNFLHQDDIHLTPGV
jgi:hypothetical protein